MPSSVLPYKTPNLRDHYEVGRKLFDDNLTTTSVCVNKSDGREYACRSLPKQKLLCKEEYYCVWQEIQIMHHLSDHPNVVRIKATYEDPLSVHLVMELCHGADLFDRIVQKTHYSEREAAQIIKTIAGFVDDCHSVGVMHRNVRPEVFVFPNAGEDAPLKAAGFGFSVFFKPGEIFSDDIGVNYYMAPEVLNKHYGPECDVWSVGVVLYILLSGLPPFWAETKDGLFKEILHGPLDFESEPWPNISNSAKELIEKMLTRDPKTRFTFHQVLCHPWIDDDTVASDRPLDSAVLSRLKEFSAMNKLKKMALHVIAKRLSEDEIGELKDLFKKIDTDNNGTITFEELKTGLRRVGADLTEHEIQAMMEAADIDNSGTIDYGEFLAATVHLNKLEREETLATAFAYFDKDGSGYITIDELSQACRDFGINDGHLDEMMREIDQNNDGKIDYGEFVAMMRKGDGAVGGQTMTGSLGDDFSFPTVKP